MTIKSEVICPKHRCHCIKRGQLDVCLKCETERSARQFSNEPGHANELRPKTQQS